MTAKSLTYRYIKVFTLITTILLILSSCDIFDAITDVFKGDNDDNISNQQEQTLTTVLNIQDDASDIMDNLFIHPTLGEGIIESIFNA